jgi:hypothetical protein
MSQLEPLSPSQPALADVCSSPRVQPYRLIHKALRVLMSRALHLAGSLDVTEPQERARLVDEVERMLAVCSDHVDHENRYFHEPLRARAPRAVLPFHEEHLEHLHGISQLQWLLQQVRDAADAQAPALAHQLYLRLAGFIAESLEHMAEEETTLTRVLWQHFSDAEIDALSDVLHAALSPQESAFYLCWMARGLNVAELTALLAGMRQAAPPAVFEQGLDLVRRELDDTRWARLARALGLPPVPGLMTR